MTAHNYRFAEAKPDAKLVNYNTVRTPELKLVYEALPDSETSTIRFKTLRNLFTFDDTAHLEQCLKFLRALDFLERPEDRVIEPINLDVFPDLSFEAKLLHHLRQQERPQNHLARAQAVAFEESPRTLDRELLVTYLERELDYINWNQTKVNMWYRLYQGVGVLSYIESRGLVLSPARALLYDLLETFRNTEDSNDFGEAVVWIERNFMSVLSNRPGTPQLHQGVADTLQNLVNDGVVDVRGMADADNEVKLPSTHSRAEEPAIKEFSLYGRPEGDRVSYRYPLEQFAEVKA